MVTIHRTVPPRLTLAAVTAAASIAAAAMAPVPAPIVTTIDDEVTVWHLPESQPEGGRARPPTTGSRSSPRPTKVLRGVWSQWTDPLDDHLYAIGGQRHVTSDGWLLGSFTHDSLRPAEAPSAVRFFRTSISQRTPGSSSR